MLHREEAEAAAAEVVAEAAVLGMPWVAAVVAALTLAVAHASAAAVAAGCISEAARPISEAAPASAAGLASPAGRRYRGTLRDPASMPSIRLPRAPTDLPAAARCSTEIVARG
jgi:hypothetical protein